MVIQKRHAPGANSQSYQGISYPGTLASVSMSYLTYRGGCFLAPGYDTLKNASFGRSLSRVSYLIAFVHLAPQKYSGVGYVVQKGRAFYALRTSRYHPAHRRALLCSLAQTRVLRNRRRGSLCWRALNGAGEFISARSEAQVQRTEVNKELQEIQQHPTEIVVVGTVSAAGGYLLGVLIPQAFRF